MAEDTDVTCAGDQLPEGWYRNPDLIQRERAAHGTLRAAANAHGVNPSTVTTWYSRLGLPPLPRGPQATKHDPANVGEPVSEAETLRARLHELERALGRARTGEIEAERLLDQIRSAVKAASPRFQPAKLKRSSADEEEAALLFSDTHASEVVRAEETLGMNAYSWDVMLDRMTRLQASMLSHLTHFSAPVRTLHLWILGDMLSGDIHEELAKTNDRPGAQAAVDFGHELARFIEELVPHFERIKVAGVPGNHPRATKKPSAKEAHNNGDWIAYQVCAALMGKHPSVEFDFPRSAFAVATVAQRWRVLLMHGRRDPVDDAGCAVGWCGEADHGARAAVRGGEAADRLRVPRPLPHRERARRGRGGDVPERVGKGPRRVQPQAVRVGASSGAAAADVPSEAWGDGDAVAEPDRPRARAGRGVTGVLGQAAELVDGDRQAVYGDATTNHERIARLFNARLHDKLREPLTAADCAALMRLVKEARLIQTPGHLDSLVDIAAYAEVEARIHSRRTP